jgi:hypothetical protein
LRGYIVGITEEKKLCSAPLRWAQMAWYTYQVSWRLVKVLKWHEGFASAIWKAVMLVLLMEGIYKVPHWKGLRWHDIHTKFHGDCFRNLSNITAIIATI